MPDDVAAEGALAISGRLRSSWSSRLLRTCRPSAHSRWRLARTA